MNRRQLIGVLVLAASLASGMGQVVVADSPTFTLDTRLYSNVTSSGFVATAESPAFTLDSRLATGNSLALIMTAESSVFTLNTRLSTGATASSLVVTAESAGFALDTRLGDSNPTLAALVVAAQSAAFALDTRLAGPPGDLIVQAVSSAFSLNTMWVGIRKIAAMTGSPVELFWPTNAPGFHPQLALPTFGPSAQWLDVTNTVSESAGFYRTVVSPEGTERYFRLKL
jgi:hypothetical protein